ncbi:MAG: iron-sulfur cluster assembly protein [Candidatus Shapirobacteria bacterium]|nr:iron-sulfur cluster assembly protein [Candidatus Shapirobacteria bacterium]MDD5073874.1 iron-sulfur cluster assembly protein [Candidatus Shapirobacteria bacterium]MDD5481751.1 iron-sulfur cluster assembly protein [Candidatus Shapirobacteria bacterium]
MREKIISALKEITDPEIDISVWDLGLIYDVAVKGGEAVIKMTLTAPGCPFMEQLTDQVKEKTAQLEGIKKVKVDLVFDPPWSPEKMSEEGRKKLGI